MIFFTKVTSKLLYVLLIAFLFIGSAKAHKYYFSLTDVAYNDKNESLEIITNVFIDDIELELNKKYGVNLLLSTKNQYAKTDSIFELYVNEKLQFSVDDTQRKYNFIGLDYENDLVFIYLEIENIKAPKKFEITNQILLENFDDQQNVVKVKIAKERKSDILNKKNVKTVLNFE